jgi:LCP family protein required for cell wall assembly
VLVSKVALGLAAGLVLTTAGIAWGTLHQLQNLGSSSAIADDAPKSQHGAQNILVMGLTTRLDQNGNPLPQEVLDQLHAGDGSQGGYNTNTMIVLHVPNDGSKAMAISIPRDDEVTFVDAPDGQRTGKIKEAYGLAKDQKWNQLYRQGVTDHNTLERDSREAGRKSTIANLQHLLNITIDHFAEISLAGFYDLATQLGGIDVCLKHATSDTNAGANFPAGKQHLNGAQALAFVRQRDNLPNNDLDRTHRQQAFLASVTSKLKGQGVFSNLGKMQGLLEVATKDVVIDHGWDVVSFGQQAQNLTGGKVEFHTLPIKGYGKDSFGSDINLIDISYIQAVVHTLFGPPAPATPTSAAPTATTTPAITGSGSIVDVRNGSRQDSMAATLATALAANGFTRGATTTIDAQSSSQIFYGKGAKEDATKIAQLLGGLQVTASSAASARHVAIWLGNGFMLPVALQGGTVQSSGTPATVVVPTDGPQGGAVDGSGIPCVD